MVDQLQNYRSKEVEDSANPDVMLTKLKKLIGFVRVWITLATILMLLLLLLNLRDAAKLPFDFLYTPTPTFTPTYTQTPTSTSTFTLTPSPTFTYTITPSQTPTNTLTLTPTLTDTVTLEPTVPPTLTISPTITETFTPSPTWTWTPSLTPTNTPKPLEYATLRWAMQLKSPDGLVSVNFPAGERVVVLDRNEASCLVRIYKEVKLGSDYISLTAWVSSATVGDVCP
ncbi:MAG: hypothetical protein ISR58_07660 [Anaerolineales bacterium]|nr:hypothetical protein [Chloroflexota bacterium]MBL6981053.1 hypothetical protein [Anaerolineales bacterium]